MDIKSLTAGQISLDEFKRRIEVYIKIRWLYIGTIGIAGLIPLFVLGGSNTQALLPGFAILLLALASNALFHTLSRWQKGLFYAQFLTTTFLLIDLAVISFAVSLGAITGFRTLVLFCIPILITGMMFGRRVVYLMSLLCGLSLGIILYRASLTGLLLFPDLMIAIIFYSSIFMVIAVLVGYMATISQSREVEAAKTDLIALASHQLRTPASAVKGFLSLVLQGAYGEVPSAQREQVAQAYLENERQLNLINSLLNVSSIDRGDIAINKTEVDLAGLSGMIGDIVAEHLELSRARKLKFKLDIPKESIKINADREKIRLVFQNLVNNACKFAREGSAVTIKVSSGAGQVKFSVTDHGSGISKKERTKLFRRFSRLGGSKTVTGEGAGLGLYVSKRIVELHNGTIGVESSADKGVTFTVSLPK